jgi:hypothetical protein
VLAQAARDSQAFLATISARETQTRCRFVSSWRLYSCLVWHHEARYVLSVHRRHSVQVTRLLLPFLVICATLVFPGGTVLTVQLLQRRECPACGRTTYGRGEARVIEAARTAIGLHEIKVGAARFPFYESTDQLHPVTVTRLTHGFTKGTDKTPYKEIAKAKAVMAYDRSQP